MKKLIIAIVSVFTLSFANAQVQFGFKAGANLSTITGDNSSAFSSAIGGHFGGVLNVALDQKFSLQPEAYISFEGAKFTSDGGFKGSVKATYVNIPVLGQYYVAPGVFLQTGVELGLLVSAKIKADKGGTADIKSSFKSTNISWAMGAGYRPQKSTVGLNIRYNLGLGNINADNQETNQTSVWQIGAIFMLKNR